MSGVANAEFQQNELESIEIGDIKKTEPRELEKKRNGGTANFFQARRTAMEAYVSRHRRAFKTFSFVLLNLFVVAFFAFASNYWAREGRNLNDCGFCWCSGYGLLIILLAFSYFALFYYLVVKRYFAKPIRRLVRPIGKLSDKICRTRYGSRAFTAVIYLSIFTAIIVFLVVDTMHSRNRLISGLGVLSLLAFGWLFSKHPADVKWRTVLCGLIMQFAFGLITIRWTVGRAIFECISGKFATFLDFAKEGASFVFSEPFVKNNVFAFSVLPVIFFFSFVIQILYYLNIMQLVMLKLGWALQMIMGTTMCESINAAGNIFLGMSESPLLIRPYISKLTSSELHAIMTSGFATVSGTVFAAYIGFGAQPVYLLTASLMSASVSLCYSKLFYPETEKSYTDLDNIEIQKSNDSGVLDAAIKGALAGIPIIFGIIANIVAFVSFIAFVNALIVWCGELVGYKNITFQFLLSRVFMPLSWLMGVPWEQCEDVGYLIGLKTVINEFIAYKELGKLKEAKKLFGRTEAIATYAICGFSNPCSIGIMIGALSAIAPEKRHQIIAVTFRAFIAGSAVCFLTASVAGMLIDDDTLLMVIENPTTNSTLL